MVLGRGNHSRVLGIVREYLCRLLEKVVHLILLLQKHFLSLEEINLGMIAAMKQQAGIHSEIVAGVIDAVAEAIKADEDLEIYTSGAKNFFKYPELAGPCASSGEACCFPPFYFLYKSSS
mgnify:CR=1 FL=1